MPHFKPYQILGNVIFLGDYVIRLQYNELVNAEFSNALRKLVTFTGFDSKTSYRISRILDEVQRAGKTLSTYLNANCELDAKLQPVFSEGGPKFKDEKGKEFMASEFEIKALKPKLHELDKVGLSPVEILALSPIIDVD